MARAYKLTLHVLVPHMRNTHSVAQVDRIDFVSWPFDANRSTEN